MSGTVNTRFLGAADNFNVPITHMKGANNKPESNNTGDVDFAEPVSVYADRSGDVVESLIAAAGRDTSPAAKRARLKTAIRAMFGELMATFIFMFCVCGIGIQANYTGAGPAVKAIIGTILQGFTGIFVIYTFADISGAHFNPAVTFATWITGKTSNRKTVGYIIAQLVGVNLAMLALYASYGSMDIFKEVAMQPPPGANIGSVFAIEFFLTFILVFVIFTVAFEDVEQQKRATMSFRGVANSSGLTVYTTTPQSKTGFAPLAIGLTLGVLQAIGGSISGACFNPARAFGPNLWSGMWSYHYVYWFAELSGATVAAGVRMGFAKFGLPKDERIPENPLPVHHL